MKTKHLRLMQRAYVILFFCFMYLPIAYMIVFSFNQSKGYSLFTGFTLKWYSSLFHNSSILHALWVSIEVALLSAIIATVLGTAASLGIASMSRRSRLLVTNITYIPVVNPEIITGISLMLLFVAYQRFAEGVSWLPDTIMGFPTLLIAHIAFNVPYVIFNVSPKLKQLDIKLYEAALDLGCDPRQAFFKVILPGAMPFIFTGLQISMGYAWFSLVAGEMLAGEYGLGYLIWNSFMLVQYPVIIIAMITLGVIGSLSSLLIRMIGNRLMQWKVREEVR